MASFASLLPPGPGPGQEPVVALEPTPPELTPITPQGSAASNVLQQAAPAGGTDPSGQAHVLVGRVPVTQGPAALDAVAAGVERRESAGKVDAASPKGRSFGFGLMGISEAVAKDHGVDPKDLVDADTNRRVGKAELERLHQKYGSWDDALAAYNWGQGNVDKWIADGRPEGKLPKETRDYIHSVLEDAGVPRDTAARVDAGKRAQPGDFGALLDQVGRRQEAGLEDEGEPSVLSRFGDFELEHLKEFGEESAALFGGAMQGVRSVALGPLQMAGEQVAPEWTREITQRINDLDDQIGLTEMARRQPIAHGAGNIIGTVAGVMTVGRMVPGSARTVAQDLVKRFVTPSRLRRVALGVGIGSIIGGTSFNPDPDERVMGLPVRLVETILGAGLGTVGITVAGVFGWAAQKVALKEHVAALTALMQKNVEGLSADTSKIKDTFAEHLAQVWEKVRGKYTVRNASGQEFEGFDPQQLSDAIDAAVSASRKEGVASVALGNVRYQMGLDAHTTRKSAWEAAQRDYERDRAKWQRDVDRRFPPSNQAVGEVVRQGQIERAIERGRLDAPPIPPAPFEVESVEAHRFSAGMQSLSEGMGKSTKADVQLGKVKEALMGVAKDVSADFRGTEEDVGTFLRRSKEASDFYKDNIGFISDVLGLGKKRPTVERLRNGMWKQGKDVLSNAQFFDRVLTALQPSKKGFLDTKKIRDLKQALGPGALPEMQRAVEWEMVQTLTRTAKGELPVAKGGEPQFAKYIADRKDGLIELFGRERVAELEGEARIAQELVNSPLERHPHIFHWGTRLFLPFIALERLWHHGAAGIKDAALLATAPFAAQLVFRSLHGIKELPYIMPLVRRAAKLRPGSPEMEQVMRQIEMRMPVRLAAEGRGVMESQREPIESQLRPVE